MAARVNWQGTKMNARSGQFTRGKSHTKLTGIFPENINLTTPKRVLNHAPWKVLISETTLWYTPRTPKGDVTRDDSPRRF